MVVGEVLWPMVGYISVKASPMLQRTVAERPTHQRVLGSGCEAGVTAVHGWQVQSCVHGLKSKTNETRTTAEGGMDRL